MTNIYVGNLSFRATEEEVREAFSRFGQVAKVSIITDRETGRSRGFAFVEMPSPDEAASAIEGLNQQEVAGLSGCGCGWRGLQRCQHDAVA